MAALLLLRRAFPSSLAPRSPPSSSFSSCLFPPPVGSPGSSFSVISRCITSSTTAAMEHPSLFRSLTGGPPSTKAEPPLPSPDGFPFTLITKRGASLAFLRQDEDGKVEVEFDLEFPKTINGNYCFDTRTSIMRGNWMVDFDIIAGSKTLLIQQVKFSQYYERNLPGFEQYVESKGITKGMIRSLLSLAKNEDGKIDCLERRPGKETPFLGPFEGIFNQAENEMQPRRGLICAT